VQAGSHAREAGIDMVRTIERVSVRLHDALEATVAASA